MTRCTQTPEGRFDVKHLAKEVSRTFDRGSPLALTSAPDSADQSFVGLKNKNTPLTLSVGGSLEFRHRECLKAQLRLMGHSVSDVGLAETMTPPARAAYARASRRQRIAAGLELPSRLAAVFLHKRAQSAKKRAADRGVGGRDLPISNHSIEQLIRETRKVERDAG